MYFGCLEVLQSDRRLVSLIINCLTFAGVSLVRLIRPNSMDLNTSTRFSCQLKTKFRSSQLYHTKAAWKTSRRKDSSTTIKILLHTHLVLSTYFYSINTTVNKYFFKKIEFEFWRRNSDF